jgi:hypothetical protein
MGAAGFFPDDANVDPERFYRTVRTVYLPLLDEQPFTFSPEVARLMLETQMGWVNEFRTFAKHIEVPPDLLFVSRIALGCHSIMTGLNATGHWRATMAEIWGVAA